MNSGPVRQKRGSWGILRQVLDATRLSLFLAVLMLAGFAAPGFAKETRVLPGADPFEETLLTALAEERKARGPDYRPRTRHLDENGDAKYSNRLLLESSPYLLQHAHNPINWYPWGDEAFEAARRTGKPVFLSIGYSTCHWCHVMEEESFEDEEIAHYMNENYVAIKVDREERPDLDSIYMSAVIAINDRGGWPMTVWLTADRHPFFGGTYFPARDGDRGTQMGLFTLLRRLRTAYDQDPRVGKSAAELVALIRRDLTSTPGETEPQIDSLHNALQAYASAFDPAYGGLRGAPKFPSSLPIRFLLRAAHRFGDPAARRIAETTLTKMARGGIYDQVGGGFHRYSTDEAWRVPHFEKMLYDNARLALAYLEGYQVTQRAEFLRVVREIFAFVDRDMSAPDGAFYSATDADSLVPGGHRGEGWYYTWTPAELKAALTAAEYELVAAHFGVTERGDLDDRNVLYVAETVEDIAVRTGRNKEELRAVIDAARAKLHRAREERPKPIRDEKILTAWNGLMITAYARAGLLLDDPSYVKRASNAASFIMRNLYGHGRLQRSYMSGRVGQNGYLDDYVFMIRALLDLYEATGNLEWFKQALALDRTVKARFEDPEHGAYFLISDDHEELLVREKPERDGVLPSGNSVAIGNLMRLYEFTTDEEYRRRAAAALKFFGDTLRDYPTVLTQMLLAVDFFHATPMEIVIITPGPRADADEFLRQLRHIYLPNRILSVLSTGDQVTRHGEYLPIVTNKKALRNRTTAYVCQRWICKLPTTDPAEFARQISGTGL